MVNTDETLSLFKIVNYTAPTALKRVTDAQHSLMQSSIIFVQ